MKSGAPERPEPEVLTRAECVERLRAGRVGRLAYVLEDGWPRVLPVNYVLDGDDIVLRTGPSEKILAVRERPTVAFEVDGIDPVHQRGWSVLALGLADLVMPDPELGERALRPWAGGRKDCWIRIRVVQITGRRIAAGWRYPDPTW